MESLAENIRVMVKRLVNILHGINLKNALVEKEGRLFFPKGFCVPESLKFKNSEVGSKKVSYAAAILVGFTEFVSQVVTVSESLTLIVDSDKLCKIVEEAIKEAQADGELENFHKNISRVFSLVFKEGGVLLLIGFILSEQKRSLFADSSFILDLMSGMCEK